MTLVDTCVWIYFLNGRSPRILDEMNRLLAADEVLGHPFVYGELLMGTGGRGRAALLRAYPDLSHARVASHESVVALVERQKLANQGIGWIDAHLLASAVAGGARLWTEEAPLKRAADKLLA